MIRHSKKQKKLKRYMGTKADKICTDRVPKPQVKKTQIALQITKIAQFNNK